MHIPGIITATGGSLLFLMVLFIPMEKAFPANKGQKFFRPQWFLDFCYFAGQYFLWSGLVLLALQYFNDHLHHWVPIPFSAKLRSQPWILQAVEVILFSDLIIYWAHRLQHHVPFLWRFHKVHHSATHLDWLAAHREHPLDSIYTISLINLPAFILGFPLETLAGVIAFRGIWAIYIHSNVRLRIGPLRMLIGSPELHHWHHSMDQHAGNYANISPLMDLLFGTYHCPPHEPERLGIEESFPTHYAGQLIAPLLPKKWGHTLFPKKKPDSGN
ncbi:MAG: sterol desaturase family protein [Chitinophagales bacterium]